MIALFLLACRPDAAPAQGCPYDVDAWYFTVPATTRTEGEVVDTNPPGDALARRTGTWDATTGELAFTDTYAQGYFLVERTVSGRYRDGAGSWTETTTDALGEVHAVDYAVAEGECSFDLTVTRPPEDGYATYVARGLVASDDRVEIAVDTTWNGNAYLRDEVLTSDLARAYTLDYDDGTLERQGVYLGDGTSTHSYVQRSNDLRYEGTDDVFFDGSHQLDFRGVDYATEQAQVDGSILYAYDGSGEGTYRFRDDEGAWVSCTWVTDGRGDCTLTCDDGQVIAC